MEGSTMKRFICVLLGIAMILMMFVTVPAKAYAAGDIEDCLDFGDSTIRIAAGDTYTMKLRAVYDYTYYIVGATSSATYLECSFKSGSQDVVFHIGADEQGKNLFFYFYVDDERLHTKEKYGIVEVYVQNIKPTNTSVAAGIAGGKTGTLTQNGNISMLYNDKGVAMASFSLTDGKGHMLSYVQQGVVNNGSNYFALASGSNNAAPAISASDKAVMQANGYAGLCINGKYVNWP